MSKKSLSSNVLDLQQKDANVRQQVVGLIGEWQLDAERFFVEALGITSITTQQKEGAAALSSIVGCKMRKWLDGPQTLTPEELKIANLEGISVMSGKGTGKDAFLAWAILWFLCCFKNSKIPLTGPSRDQMRDVLLAEIAKWINRTDKEGNQCFVFYDDIVVQTDKIFMKNKENPNEEGKSWWARLKTAPKAADKKTQAKNMDGLHEDYMMVGVDEADGVPEPVLSSLETTTTGPVNFALLIFNPTKSYGYAYETHYDTRAKFWWKLHWDSRFSENVDQDKTARTLEIHGEDSTEYRVNVLGLPPTQSEDTLLPQNWIDNAKGREYITDDTTLRIMGLDPARLGEDPAAVIIRDGKKIIDMMEFKKLKIPELAEAAAEVFLEWECDHMYVDMIGIGAGVYDLLDARFPGKITGVDVNTKTKEKPQAAKGTYAQKKRFNRLRDELYWKVRTTFENGTISFPAKHKLTKKFVNECMAMKRDEKDCDTSVIKIEGKMKMKSRGVKSPNILEAYMVTMKHKDSSFKSMGEPKTKKRKDPWDEIFDQQGKSDYNQSWMSV